MGDPRPRLMAVTLRATAAHRIRRIGGLHTFYAPPDVLRTFPLKGDNAGGRGNPSHCVPVSPAPRRFAGLLRGLVGMTRVCVPNQALVQEHLAPIAIENIAIGDVSFRTRRRLCALATAFRAYHPSSA